jgi:CRP-like cAMP-binding protein
LHAIDPGPLSNELLASLPREDFKFLSAHLTTHGIAQGTVLFEPDDEIDHIYFPLSGMVSLVMVMKDGKAIETATVGREGVVGAMAGLGLHRTRVRGGYNCRCSLPLFRLPS